MSEQERHALLMQYRYAVIIQEKVMGFRSVTGLKRAVSYEPLEVGGANTTPVMLRSPVKDAGKVVLERGKYFSSKGRPLSLQPGDYLEDVLIWLNRDKDGRPAASIELMRVYLESIELSDLNAMGSEVVVEKMTLVHHGITEKLHAD